MFSAGKVEFCAHYKFCVYHNFFGLRKVHEYLTPIFDVLPKQKTCEIKTFQVQVYITQ